MFISLHFYFSRCSMWPPPCACITIIRRFDHWLMAPSIKSWLIVRGRPLQTTLQHFQFDQVFAQSNTMLVLFPLFVWKFKYHFINIPTFLNSQT